mgnify:CR=1 FL=1
MTAMFLRSWGCRLLKGGVGWRGGAGIFRFPPKLTVSHFQMEVEDFFFFFLPLFTHSLNAPLAVPRGSRIFSLFSRFVLVK